MTLGLRGLGRVSVCPVADGGDGTLETVVSALRGRFLSARVTGPLGEKRIARWGWVARKKLAVIEMAEASGLKLVARKKRNPLRATTFGTGELLLKALDKGAKTVLIGLGGSATVDGGVGLAQALGARFWDSKGRLLPLVTGGTLDRIARASKKSLDPRLKKTVVLAACDVTHPLLGAQGAARVFGPQKGASPTEVRRLERGLKNFSRVVERDLGVRAHGARTGAAGGLGAGLKAFARAKLCSGSALVLEMVSLVKYGRAADLVLTGEGRLDAGTLNGKAPGEVARRARARGVPTVAICGSVEERDRKRLERFFRIYPFAQKDPARAMNPREARKRMESTARRVTEDFLGSCRGRCENF